MRTDTRRRARLAVALLVAALGAVACLPARPATGRAGKVRKVELLGDSLTFGLFGASPGVQDRLAARLATHRISLTVDGGPGDTPPVPWPGRPNWADQLQARVTSTDPDVVIIQTVLFLDADSPGAQAAYRQAMTKLLDIAQSRGAHVYLVRHQRPTDAAERHAAEIAESLQAEVAAGRGIEFIPLNWWLARCRKAYIADGWHLSANGSTCWADAANAAVNQLRNAVG